MKQKIALRAATDRLGRRHAGFGRNGHWTFFAMAVPGILFLLAFNYVPLFGLILPFKNLDYSKGIFGSDWCGFKNFEFFFKSQDAWRVTRNTIVLNAIFIITTLVCSVALALLLFELKDREVKIYQTAIFVPYFISWIVASYIVHVFIAEQNGVVPHFLQRMGLPEIKFYYESAVWRWILPICNLWKSIGYNTLLYYASLTSIDTTYYEAAAIDGATRLQRTWYITIPHLKPIIIMVTFLAIGRIFNSDFGMFYFLTKNSGALYEVTDVIDTYVFRALRVVGDIGMSSAVALYQSVVGFILVLLSNWFVKKNNPDYAMF